MRIFNLTTLFVFFSFCLKAQEVFLRNTFSVRDFIVKKDSVFLIEKRDVKYFNYTLSNGPLESYFIGGYGLKLYDDSINKEIISISNEFVQTVSSLRFYNKLSKAVEQVYYYKEGKSIDALIIPELKYAVMSMSNKKIIVIDYAEKPAFKMAHNIELKSISRKVIYKEDQLFYITDSGDIFSYNLNTKKNNLIHSCGKRITDFIINNEYIVYATDEGDIVRYNSLNNTLLKQRIYNNLVLNMLTFHQKKLICGTFKGSIIVLNMDDMAIINQLNYHKRSVLKIFKGEGDVLYSSSIDKTIKKWTLNY